MKSKIPYSIYNKEDAKCTSQMGSLNLCNGAVGQLWSLTSGGVKKNKIMTQRESQLCDDMNKVLWKGYEECILWPVGVRVGTVWYWDNQDSSAEPPTSLRCDDLLLGRRERSLPEEELGGERDGSVVTRTCLLLFGGPGFSFHHHLTTICNSNSRA